MDGISRETFKPMNVESKLDVLFDYAVEARETAKIAHQTVQNLTETVKGRKKIDTTVAAFMGVVGGFIGFFSTAIYKGKV